MANSFLLPIDPGHDFAQARICGLKIEKDYQLLVNKNIVSSFKYCFARERRSVIVYERNRQLPKEFTFDSIKVELDDSRDVIMVVEAVQKLFPNSIITVIVDRRYYMKLKLRFKMQKMVNIWYE